MAAAAIDTLNAFERGGSPVKPEVLAHGIQIEKQNELERARAAEEARRIEEERARLEDAERRIRELRQRIGTLIARANAATTHDEAIALLNEALGLDPEHGEVKELLEERHRLRQKEEAAERRARSLATVKERIVRHLERGELEEAEGALASADALAAPAEDLAPFRERLAQSRADRRREAEAARAAAEAEARKRREIEGHLSEAEQYLTRGKLTNAIVVTDLALGLDPEHTEARALQADIQRAIEAQKEAEQRVARLMAAAQAAVDEQRFQEATDALEHVRAIAPDTAGLPQLLDLVQAGLDAQRAAELARQEAERERRALDKMLARAKSDTAVATMRLPLASPRTSSRGTVKTPRPCRFVPKSCAPSRTPRCTRLDPRCGTRSQLRTPGSERRGSTRMPSGYPRGSSWRSPPQSGSGADFPNNNRHKKNRR